MCFYITEQNSNLLSLIKGFDLILNLVTNYMKIKEPGFEAKEAMDSKTQLEAFLGTPPKEDDEREVWMKENKGKIREIIESGFVGDQKDKDAKRVWLFEALFSYYNFQKLRFNTGLVNCSGADLLSFLGLPSGHGKESGKDYFYDFTREIFPKESEALAWMDEKFPYHMIHKERRARVLIGELNEEDKKGTTDDEIREVLGYTKEEMQKDPVFSASIEKALKDLTPVEEIVVRFHIFEDKDFAEIGQAESLHMSGDKVRQIFYQALRKMRRSLENRPFKLSQLPRSEQIDGLHSDKSQEDRRVINRIRYVLEDFFRKNEFLTATDIKDLLPIGSRFKDLYDRDSIDVDRAVGQFLVKLNPRQRQLVFDKIVEEFPIREEDSKNWKEVEEVMVSVFEEMIGSAIFIKLMEEYEMAVPSQYLQNTQDATKAAKFMALHQAIRVQARQAEDVIINKKNSIQQLKAALAPIRKDIEKLVRWYNEEKRTDE